MLTVTEAALTIGTLMRLQLARVAMLAAALLCITATSPPAQAGEEQTRFVLRYEQGVDAQLPARATQRVRAAIRRVEQYLGKLEHNAVILTKRHINPAELGYPKATANRVLGYLNNQKFEHATLGTCWRVQVVPDGFTSDILAHELTHARVRELGSQLPWAIDEGIAYFVENHSNKGWSDSWWEIIEKFGVGNNLNQLSQDLDAANHHRLNMQGCATGCLIVYYYATVSGMKLADILAMDWGKAHEWLMPPSKILEAVKRYREELEPATDAGPPLPGSQKAGASTAQVTTVPEKTPATQAYPAPPPKAPRQQCPD